MTRNPNDRTDERGGDERGDPAAPLAERLRVADAAELAALERVWEGLELPPAAGVPPGFARRVATVAAARGVDSVTSAGWWALRSAWWAGAVVLATGIALGALLSAGLAVDDAAAAEDEVDAEESLADATLAAHYLDAVDEDSSATGPAPDAGPGEVP